MNNNISSDIVEKCICRYNKFKLCFRDTNNSEYCRYHKNTKNGYIHKIFYDVLKNKETIDITDLYELYKYVNNITINNKELFIELLKNIPYNIICNIIENGKYYMFKKNNYSSKIFK